MVITLVRHGQTDANYLEKIQGLKNNLLNDTGRRQCQRLREQIKDKKYDVCYMSPLVRTVETAMILIGERVEMIPDKRLLERDMGLIEGKDRNLYDAKKYWDYDLNCTDDEIEGVQEIFKRCQDFLDYIFEKYDDDTSILIVSHGAVIRALHYLLKKVNLSTNLLDVDIGNCYYEEIRL